MLAMMVIALLGSRNVYAWPISSGQTTTLLFVSSSPALPHLISKMAVIMAPPLKLAARWSLSATRDMNSLAILYGLV